MIDIEVLEIVVKVYASSAKVSSEKSSVGCEDGSEIDVSLPAEGDSDADLPFVKVCDDCGSQLFGNILKKVI